MVKKIAEMVQTKTLVVHLDNAALERSNVKTATVRHQLLSVMAPMTVVMVPMNKTVTYHVPNWNLNVNQMDVASSKVGSVMEMQTAKMEAMKTPLFATKDHAIQKPNSPAKTDAAFQNCGCAILTTIAVTTPMNQRTCADKRTAPLAGRDVQVDPTTDAFQNGCSAMEKTTVAMDPMRNQKTVRNATQTQTLNAPITGKKKHNIMKQLTNRKVEKYFSIYNIFFLF